MGLFDWGHKEWSRFRLRAIWSWQGLRDGWCMEKSVRQWVLANLVSFSLTLIIPMSGGERGLILALGVLVLAAELMNTAVERAVDHTSTDRSELARQAKDLASSAVMVTAFAVGVAWVAILLG